MGEEGCLSIPGFREQVRRAQARHAARAERQGRVLRNDRRRSAGARLPARDRSPERRLYITHISALKRDLMKRKIKKLQRAGRVGLNADDAPGLPRHARLRRSHARSALAATRATMVRGRGHAARPARGPRPARRAAAR